MMRTRTLSALVATAVLAAGCAGSSTETAAPQGDPVRGGTLRYAVASYPECIDAAVRARLFSGPQQFVETLTDQDADGDIVPRLARSWEITDGGRTYTFELRDDVTFSDGSPLTAEVVRANLDALVTLAADGNADTPVNSALNSYAGSDVLDDHTVRVRFDLPELGFLRNASDPYLGIYAASTAAASYEDRCAGKLVGSGPFVITEAVRNQRIVLERRDGYNWAPEAVSEHQGEAYLDRIEFQVVPESGVRVGGLQSGQFDVIDEVPATDQEALKASGAQVVFGTIPNLNPGVYHNPYSQFGADVVLRRAILKGIDREEIRDTLYSPDYPVPTGLVAASTPLAADQSEELAYDPEAAKELLEADGWVPGPDGVRVRDGARLAPKLNYVAGSTRGASQQDLELIQQQLKQVGIDVRLVPTTAAEESANLKNVAEADYDFASGAGLSKDIDFLIGLFRATNRRLGGFPDPELENQIDALDFAENDEQRLAAADALQRYLIAEADWIPVREATRVFATAADVHGYRIDPYGESVFYDTWIAR
ncbi:ABC transporter substrate-binding protein [Mycolicibacterium vaccae]|uniref:Transporter peptide-binding protein n=1 Tax=Mycolicibacterium vaccae ATCC 25954 TaxID=1194972 RepID=K0UPH6_MYCVA|nr:ABC transporter substrate-binding protein [Mycolicibacterium vaccae]ANI39998.1 peptide ABC transporter substrate-binding protein [Mycolicibacterium vaccae 95051]EJZ09037.1 transporter peptide-binding protein [Mycolicibacterium vaccae ATCC 25954]